MRFKASIQNISTFAKLTASLASLGPVAWVRLNEDEVRFTIIPEQGTQVWAVLVIDTIFDEDYNIQSAANNVINLEVPLAPLQRALKSALAATSASIRLTKKDNMPILSLTIVTSPLGGTHGAFGSAGPSEGYGFGDDSMGIPDGRDRETVVTQDVPVRVLNPNNVEGIHEPRCREPDVHILLPPLLQLKSISDRFTKLALAAKANGAGGGAAGPRLEMAANMHGCLKLSIRTDAMNISSVWTGLSNPDLDPSQVEGGEEGIRNHPSTRMRELGSADGRSEEGWATVRIDGRDWSKVMSVGRLGGRVIACFCHDHALILYVYLPNDEDGREDSVLTYYVSSYSE
ncbi:Hus1-like protein [Macrophomina phaseolina MS6]|uniref:Checkpoint protein n=2 Tax=Macrophomina phaseolina TaxID=35725 RepID=K2SX31_MACPH|nr:Hus1-like protein [Macrophomina phaseolina MS6]KAH7058912.1 checkpoint protein Hus1/Mec3 [Macrophomina phaseolina]